MLINALSVCQDIKGVCPEEPKPYKSRTLIPILRDAKLQSKKRNKIR